MKASDAKPFIGKLVSYKKAGWTNALTGIVQSTEGRNIIMDDDTLWAPDITDMQLATPSGDVQLMIDWWLAQKPFGMSVDEYLERPANWVANASKPLAIRAAKLYAQLHPADCSSNGESILDTNYLNLPWALRTVDESIGSLDDARGDIVVQVQQRSDDFKTKNAVRRDTTGFVLAACNSHKVLVDALVRIRAGRSNDDLALRLSDTEMARIADETLTAAGLGGATSPWSKQVLSK